MAKDKKKVKILNILLVVGLLCVFSIFFLMSSKSSNLLNKNQIEAWQRHQNEQLAYTFSYPSEYQVIDSLEETAAFQTEVEFDNTDVGRCLFIRSQINEMQINVGDSQWDKGHVCFGSGRWQQHPDSKLHSYTIGNIEVYDIEEPDFVYGPILKDGREDISPNDGIEILPDKNLWVTFQIPSANYANEKENIHQIISSITGI